MTRFFPKINGIDNEDLILTFDERKEVETQCATINNLHFWRKGVPFPDGVYYMDPDSFILKKYVAEPYDCYR